MWNIIRKREICTHALSIEIKRGRGIKYYFGSKRTSITLR